MVDDLLVSHRADVFDAPPELDMKSDCPSVVVVSEPGGLPNEMSGYEHKRWTELQEHWEKKAQPNSLLPPKARSAISAAGTSARDVATKAGRKITGVTPQQVKDVTEMAFDSALVPAAERRCPPPGARY